MFVLGFLIYSVLLESFFRANAVSSTMMKVQPDFVPLVLSQIGWGAFVTLVIGQWGGVSTLAGGLCAGAVIGAVLGFSLDFEMFATPNLQNLQATCVDVVVTVVRFGVAGGVVGQVLGMGGKR